MPSSSRDEAVAEIREALDMFRSACFDHSTARRTNRKHFEAFLFILAGRAR